METGDEQARRPLEITIALIVIVLTLAAGTLLVLVELSIEQKLGHAVGNGRYLRLAFNLAISLAYAIGLAKGYGKFRWLFVAGLVLTSLFLLVAVLAWLGSEGQMHTVMAFIAVSETVLVLLRIVALVLLFRPEAERWFDLKAAARQSRNRGDVQAV